jgi:hypothetical protein
MTHYLVANYLLPAFVRVGDAVGSMGVGLGEDYYRKIGFPMPRNFTVCRIDAKTVIRGAYYDRDRGLLMIQAPSRRRAYEVGEALNGHFSVFMGYEQDPTRDGFWLQECRRVPRAEWSEQDFLNNLLNPDPYEPERALHDLQSGYGLQFHHLDHLARYLPALAGSATLTRALMHFRESRQLFFGFMVGSYYHSHYRHERREAPRWLMEKRYYEQKTRYELAFVAAFKAIESFFGVPMLKEGNLDAAFARLPFPLVAPDKLYRRRHEVFSRFRVRITYRDLILHFLKLRNAVAAHANPSPPPHFLLSEDNLFEIQLFVTHLIGGALEGLVPGRSGFVIDPALFPATTEAERPATRSRSGQQR